MLAARFHADPKARDWNCAACSDQVRRLRNCNGGSNPAFRETFSGLVVRRCPLAEISVFSRHLLNHYARLGEHHVLPKAGGVGDQDSRTMEGLDRLAGEMARLARLKS